MTKSVEQEIQSAVEEIERVSDTRRLATVIQRPLSPDGNEAGFKVEVGMKPPTKEKVSYTYLLENEAIIVWGDKDRRFRKGKKLDPHIVENDSGHIRVYPYDRQSVEFLQSRGLRLREALI